MELLQLLAGQAAISMENAILYDNLDQKVQERTAELSQALKQLQETQAQLVQSEKMASLGTLVSGVAHELNNPNNFVHSGVQTLERDLQQFNDFLFELIEDEADEELTDEFHSRFDRFNNTLSSMMEGSQRIELIVSDLRTFSRLQEAEQKTMNIVESLKATLHLVTSKYEDQIDFIENYQDVPEINCWPAQLNQVFMNIILNACQAIQVKQEQAKIRGQIKIQVYSKEGQMVIQFTDTGCGMDEEVQSKLFDPFFTTREVGEGTGLGMAIAYGIVKKHNGRIDVDSEPNQGTTIALLLPLMEED